MRLRIPPVLVAVFFAGCMYLLDCYLPVGEFEFFGRHALIWALGAGALVIGFLALAQFIRARTTINPNLRGSSATVLVTGGIFKFSRNPMYLALLLLLLAWGLWLGNAFNTLFAALFVAYMNRFQIKPEEEALTRKFGTEYQQYCIRVRRWF